MTQQTEALDLTAALAAFAVRPRLGAGRIATTDEVAAALLDTVGVAIAGQPTEGPRILAAWLAASGATGPAAIWGTATTTSAADAALINGTAAHVLDWDDASPAMPMHPSAVLFPAMLAQAAQSEAEGQTISGQAMVAAYNVGASVFRAVSEALPIRTHVARGWHNTATTGRIATIAALANLTGCDERTTRRAIGMAVSLASGSIGNFGSMTKSLHAGLVARDAIMAIGLARRGFDAEERMLEHHQGYFALYGDPDPARLAELPARLDHWETEWVHDWSIKRHPCCYGTHHAVDAAIALGDGIDLDAVERIDVRAYTPDLALFTEGAPTTGLEAKFSMEYVVSAALSRGPLGLPDFEPQAFTEPGVVDLMQRVHVEGAGDSEPSRFAELRIAMRDGSELQRRVDVTYGDSNNPMDAAALCEKFTSACAGVDMPQPAIDALADASLAAVDAPSLTALQSALLVR